MKPRVVCTILILDYILVNDVAERVRTRSLTTAASVTRSHSVDIPRLSFIMATYEQE